MKGHKQHGTHLGTRHWRLFAGLAALLVIVLFTLFRPIHPGGLTDSGSAAGQVGSTLVVYVYQNTEDEDQKANFNYFMRHGMDAADGNSYIVIAQELAQQVVARLPSNARLIRMPAICFWGMLGTLLESGAISQALLQSFTNIVVASSFVRGPFLPVPLQESGLPWTLGLTRKLQAPVQLVAPTISCSRIHGIGPPALDGVHESVPHVSWQAFAMTQDALQLMLKDGDVFKCHNPHKMGAAEFSAARASLAVLLSGANLDSLLMRYQGVDWTEPITWDCNGRHPPGGESAYDGITLHPLEVMFTEVDKLKLYSGLSSSRAAKRYDMWHHAQAQGRLNVSVNIFALDSTPFHKEKIAYMKSRGPGCFDAAYYAAQSHDLQQSGLAAPGLWEHFVNNGQFEGRPFRFSCVDLKGRGPGCFDHDFYNDENVDLHDLRLQGQGMDAGQAWHHFVTSGQFEGRHFKFRDECGQDIDSPNVL